jgi:antitoxin PrlF
MTRTMVRPKGQITLPTEVRKALHVEEGDDVAFIINDDGTVTLTGLKSIPADQAWFWTEEWQAGEREASLQLAGGAGTVYESADEFLDSLD